MHGLIKVGGEACRKYGGKVAIKAEGSGKYAYWFELDVGNSIQSLVNGIGSLFGADDLSQIKTKCDFVVVGWAWNINCVTRGRVRIDPVTHLALL
ncbi:hypothetical protein EV191_11297 [Tamaricihabitans halophyticus]|uniref:Uncharacterized protein n=1 Tax=Tamaricihabitans halophyticus TaxID=1262583 RepID=A0A4R2QJT5_9PSEU|nr:hypothetical protein [Tamaricihabitans halophyticus]TCP47301.1 hypothetical protein EV191_11297 [Tamaricihabitans halophyticus]